MGLVHFDEEKRREEEKVLFYRVYIGSRYQYTVFVASI
jgi:hypothetical protein